MALILLSYDNVYTIHKEDILTLLVESIFPSAFTRISTVLRSSFFTAMCKGVLPFYNGMKQY